jgi:TRAP-type C4-dicarboxylate transport system substrate-binding protein
VTALAALCAALATRADQTAPDQIRPVTLRLADGLPSGHIIDRLVIEPFIQEVGRETGGAVAIQHFPAEQLGKSRDMLMLTLSGVADIGFIVPSYISDKMPLTAVTELPGIFQTTCQGNAALRALTGEDGILERREFAPNGVRPLIIFLMPAYQLVLSSDRRFDGIKDIGGLKIRTPGGAMDLTVLGVGAVPIRVAPPEIYESMARGTLDGALLPYQSAVSYHLPSLLKSGTMGEDFGTVAITFSISERRWRSLPEAARETIAAIGRRISEQACAAFDRAEDLAIAKAREAGMRPVVLGEADRAPLVEAFAAVRRDWAARLDARGKPGTEILAAFTTAVAAARAD